MPEDAQPSWSKRALFVVKMCAEPHAMAMPFEELAKLGRAFRSQSAADGSHYAWQDRRP